MNIILIMAALSVSLILTSATKFAYDINNPFISLAINAVLFTAVFFILRKRVEAVKQRTDEREKILTDNNEKLLAGLEKLGEIIKAKADSQIKILEKMSSNNKEILENIKSSLESNINYAESQVDKLIDIKVLVSSIVDNEENSYVLMQNIEEAIRDNKNAITKVGTGISQTISEEIEANNKIVSNYDKIQKQFTQELLTISLKNEKLSTMIKDNYLVLKEIIDSL